MTDATSLTAALRRGPNPLRGEAPAHRAAKPLRILFLVSAHNSLSQRAQIALQTTGCDTAQGFLFSRPEHPDVVDALVMAPSR